jgi:molybdate transport system substrate-binding protein
MRRLLLPIVLLLAAGLAGAVCPQPQPLTVFAAASLAAAFREMAPEFERAADWKVRFSFGASSALRAQVQQGAPADVFASADWAQMRPLAAARVVAEPVVFARNRLVVAVPAANPGRIRSPADLSRPGVRLVSAPEVVPIGGYTQRALRKLALQPGYGSAYSARVNANVVSREPNVRAILAKVELGEADAAIVYESDARSSRRVRAIPIPDAANVLAEYPAAVVTASRHRAGAEAFIRYLGSAQARAILRARGFR